MELLYPKSQPLFLRRLLVQHHFSLVSRWHRVRIHFFMSTFDGTRLICNQGSNTSTPTGRTELGSADWTVADVQEFVPQGFDGAHVVSPFRLHLPARKRRNPRPGHRVVLFPPHGPVLCQGPLPHMMPEPLFKRLARGLKALHGEGDSSPQCHQSPDRNPRIDPDPADSSMQSALQGNGNGIHTSASFDPFVTTSTPLSATGGVGSVSTNPYTHDPTGALTGGAFFANGGGFQQPVGDSKYVSASSSL